MRSLILAALTAITMVTLGVITSDVLFVSDTVEVLLTVDSPDLEDISDEYDYYFPQVAEPNSIIPNSTTPSSDKAVNNVNS